MKNCILLIFTVSIFSCQKIYTQTKEHNNFGQIDSLFQTNLATLDSVGNGYKKLSQLSSHQNAFLYLISTWTNLNLKMTYAGIQEFTKQDVNTLKSWYSKYASKIDAEDVFQSLKIYNNSFETGLLSNPDLERLDKISKKYHQFKSK